MASVRSVLHQGVSAEGSLDPRDTVNRAVDTRSEVTSWWQDFVTDRMGRGGELGPRRLPSFQYVQLDAGGATDAGRSSVVALTQIMFEMPLGRAERADLGRSGFKDPECERKVCARNTDLDVIGIHVARQAKGVDDITRGSSVDKGGSGQTRSQQKEVGRGPSTAEDGGDEKKEVSWNPRGKNT